ncbi:MAG TPA: hypothetical protein VHY80_02805 [Stellaceae bacterium]|jgi:hypothetical protein|nr:hypothetical protein [Stellaceae bacterium]
MMMEARTLSAFDRAYTIERLKRQARTMRLESARAAAVLATQLRDLATTIEAEADALAFKTGEQSHA